MKKLVLDMKARLMSKNDILVIRIKPGNPDADVYHLQKQLIEQKESGVVILPSWTEAVIVPKGMKIEVEKE